MKIQRGHFGDIALDGLHWASVVRWPGRIDEGDGEVQPIVDATADERQREALLTIMSGEAGGTLFEIFAAVCPHVKEPVFAGFDAWEFDLDNRSGRVRAGDVIETEVETLRGIDPPDPYRVVVRIPGGFEYTGPNDEAETAVATRLRTGGAIQLDLTESHSTMAQVKYEGQVPSAA